MEGGAGPWRVRWLRLRVSGQEGNGQAAGKAGKRKGNQEELGKTWCVCVWETGFCGSLRETREIEQVGRADRSRRG